MYLIGKSTNRSTRPALRTEAGPGTSKPYRGGGPTRREGEAAAAFVLAVLTPPRSKAGHSRAGRSKAGRSIAGRSKAGRSNARRTAEDLLLLSRKDRMA